MRLCGSVSCIKTDGGHIAGWGDLEIRFRTYLAEEGVSIVADQQSACSGCRKGINHDGGHGHGHGVDDNDVGVAVV